MKIVIRNIDQFLSDLDIVWTNASAGAGGQGLSSGQENTLHEYCHFVTLGLRTRWGTNTDPGVYRGVCSHLDKHKDLAEENEIRALSAQVLIMQALGAFAKSGCSKEAFLYAIQDNLPAVKNIKTRVLDRLDAKALSDARRVIRRVRSHAVRIITLGGG